jgi:hypothetical protein
MKTAVQLRHPQGPDRPRTRLFHGEHSSIVWVKLGPVVLFEPGELVAYELRFRRRSRLFVFRTLAVDDPLAATVPGVHPRVRLLFQVATPRRMQRARGLFAQLERTGRDASALPDDFYVRVGGVLAGRLPSPKALTSLLEDVCAAPQPAAAGDAHE